MGGRVRITVVGMALRAAIAMFGTDESTAVKFKLGTALLVGELGEVGERKDGWAGDEGTVRRGNGVRHDDGWRGSFSRRADKC